MIPEGRKTYDTHNPATGKRLATTIQGRRDSTPLWRLTAPTLPIGTQEDVDTAVGVASKAYESWSKLSGHVRARHMYSIARHVQKHAR